MAVANYTPLNTQTNPGTGGIIYDLGTGFGTGSSLASDNVNSTAYTECIAFQRDVGTTVNDTTFDVTLGVDVVTGTLNGRYRVQRVNSSNVVQASSGYGTVFTAAGQHDNTLTLSTTWAAGDRLRISVEIQRTAGHGNVSIGVIVNGFDVVSGYSSDITYDIFDVVRRVFHIN